MAYAIIESGSKQYKVSEGDIIDVEKLDVKENTTINNVLLMVDGEKVEIGRPYIQGAKVSAKLLAQGKEDKKIVFRYKNKINYRKKSGHRQPYTRIQIESITLS
jgi:large subunit ribosomal protein L21